MYWLETTLEALSTQPLIGYAPQAAPATEPTAIAALTLLAHGKQESAKRAVDFLASIQLADGSVGVREKEPDPKWPTSLAVLAWAAYDRKAYAANIDRAVNWILNAKGKAMEQTSDMGHNTQLVGWSWAEGTHSWIEPTAFHILALKASGHLDDPRTREGVTLLLDRQLPSGGCNYGNTSVLGQMLRPHVQPTGIALLALAGEQDQGNRIAKSVAWLKKAMSKETTPASLAWGLLGLTAHGVKLPDASKWMAAAAKHLHSHDGSPHKLALLALASVGPKTLTPKGISTEY
ncbi:MAG: terpene cyclase/mutase family protein [Planctomycetales bacterium]|nr:terpene cyclase/mutase family protein [Planctomycetales bacterium]